MQSRRRSVYESISNIVIGLILSVILNYLYLWYRGYDVKWIDMGGLGFLMTIASFVRSYCIRRWYNRHD